jgi:hypothetical protein
MEELIKLAAGNGVWAVLSIILIKWILDTNKDREAKLQQTIADNQQIILRMTEKLEVLNHLKADVDIILECLTCPPETITKRGITSNGN